MRYDITDKLSFDENPVIEIRGELFEVNADAENMLKIMNDFSTMTEIEASLSAYKRLFSESARDKISSLKLPMKDLMLIIQTAMFLAQGEDPEKHREDGEAPRSVL